MEEGVSMHIATPGLSPPRAAAGGRTGRGRVAAAANHHCIHLVVKQHLIVVDNRYAVDVSRSNY